ncbi:hypothetical protein GIB67_037224 [Kingdonia uniflora]|uniref:Uncharacterized protein n=1 Tax=Kingdonia uniflora TaxID=39325 RepID=A0A7J7MRW6_9MAGN|nr:hypothetical protein GIB67_037224 [Kingdonia uniflora]
MFAALPEEEKGVIRATCFAPLLLIDSIVTMSTLVIEIFDRHLGDMKMRQFPKKKNTYGLKEIDDALKQAKLERHLGDVLRLNLLKIILSFHLPNKGRNVWVKYVDMAVDLDHLKFPRIEESIHLFPKLQGWRMTSFKRRQIVTFEKFFANPKLLVVKDLMVDDDVEVNLEVILFEYGGGLLKTMVVAEVAKTDIVFFSQEEIIGEAYQVSTDQTTVVSADEQTIEVVQTEVVISHKEEDVGEASQVIDVYIKALIQYFDTQHRAHPDKERIVLAVVFAYQYMGRAFNAWTHNMSSP